LGYALGGSAEGEPGWPGWGRIPSVEQMNVVEIAPWLHWLRFPVGHAYLWQGDDGLTLVDSGQPGSGAAIADAIRGLGHRTGDVRRLFLTHFYEDHVGGAAEVATWGDTTVYAHHADAPVIRGAAVGPAPALSGWERDLFERVRAGMSPQPPAPVRVDRELAGSEVIDDGGQVISVPGHTPGSAALLLPVQVCCSPATRPPARPTAP
jgi:glyoxylase-like metal-dependent hydrolase (beta-lactamase superfamily II)